MKFSPNGGSTKSLSGSLLGLPNSSYNHPGRVSLIPLSHRLGLARGRSSLVIGRHRGRFPSERAGG